MNGSDRPDLSPMIEAIGKAIPPAIPASSVPGTSARASDAGDVESRGAFESTAPREGGPVTSRRPVESGRSPQEERAARHRRAFRRSPARASFCLAARPSRKTRRPSSVIETMRHRAVVGVDGTSDEVASSSSAANVAPIDCGLTNSARASAAVVEGPCDSRRFRTPSSDWLSPCSADSVRRRRRSAPRTWRSSSAASSVLFAVPRAISGIYCLGR